MRLLSSAALAGIVALSACAQAPENIAPNVVSPVQYAGYSCQQLASEGQRISAQLAEYTGRQHNARSNDTATVTAAVIFLPIAGLFAMGGPDFAPQIAQLRGEVTAIQSAAVAAGCSVVRG